MAKKICQICGYPHNRGDFSKKRCLRIRRQKLADSLQKPLGSNASILNSTFEHSVTPSSNSDDSEVPHIISDSEQKNQKVYFYRPQQFPQRRHPKDDGKCQIYMTPSEADLQQNPKPVTMFDGDDSQMFVANDSEGLIPQEKVEPMELRSGLIKKAPNQQQLSRTVWHMRLKRQVDGQRQLKPRGSKFKYIRKVDSNSKELYKICKQTTMAFRKKTVPNFLRRLPSSLRRLWCPPEIEVGPDLDLLFFKLQTNPWAQMIIGDSIRFQLMKLRNLNSQQAKLAVLSKRQEWKKKKQSDMLDFWVQPALKQEKKHFKSSINKLFAFGLFSQVQKNHLLASYSNMREIMCMEYYNRIFNFYITLKNQTDEVEVHIIRPYKRENVDQEKKRIGNRDLAVRKIIHEYARFGQWCFVWNQHILKYDTAFLVESHWKRGFRYYQTTVLPIIGLCKGQNPFQRELDYKKKKWQKYCRLPFNEFIKPLFTVKKALNEVEPSQIESDHGIEEEEDYDAFVKKVNASLAVQSLVQSHAQGKGEQIANFFSQLASFEEKEEENSIIGTIYQGDPDPLRVQQSLSIFLRQVSSFCSQSQRFLANERLLEERLLLKCDYPKIPKSVMNRRCQQTVIFKRPELSSRQDVQFEEKQIQYFLINKNYRYSSFSRRQNYFERNFQYPSSFEQMNSVKLNPVDEQTLSLYQDRLITYPIRYRYINEKFGGGFDASRDIECNQFLGFFNGLVLPMEVGNDCGNNAYMVEYVSGKSLKQMFVVTTLVKTWGIGPMYNGSKKANMDMKTFWTGRGLQLGLCASRKIKKGEHLVWDYQGQNNSYKKRLIDIQDYINRNCRRSNPNPKSSQTIQTQDPVSAELQSFSKVNLDFQYNPILREISAEQMSNEQANDFDF